jgi:RimJ/RimL family protein N-acetyltransferase
MIRRKLDEVILETKNLILRPYKKSDAKFLVENYNDKVFLKNLPYIPYPYNLEAGNKFIKIAKFGLKKERPTLELVVFLKSEKRVIGGVSLKCIDFKNKNAVSGSCLAKQYWGTKLIYEAKLELYKFAFKELKLVKISSKVLSHNIRSKKHLEKLAFTQQGYFQKDLYVKGKYLDVFYMELLKGNFKYKELKNKLF